MVIGEDHEADKKRGFRITERGVVLGHTGYVEPGNPRAKIIYL